MNWPRLRLAPLLALLGALTTPTPVLNARPSARDAAKLFFADSQASDARLTPGNRGLSHIASFGGKGQLRLLDLERGTLYRLRPEDNSSVYDYHWIDRESAIVLTHHLGAPLRAFATNYRLSADVPTLFTLVYDTLPDTRNFYLAKEGRVTDKFPDLYRVNLYTQSKIRVMENPGRVLAWYTDKHGVPRIQYTIDENEKDRFDYRSGEHDEWRPIDIDGHPMAVLFLGDSERFALFIRRSGHDKYAAYTFDGATNQYVDTILSDPLYDILPTRFIVDPENEESLGFHYDLEKPESHWFDEKLAAVHETLRERWPNEVCEIAGYDSSGASVVYRRQGDRQPGQWRRFDPATQADHLLLEEYPNVDTQKTAPTEAVSFLARDSERIYGYLTKPLHWDGGPAKALLMIHGGPRYRDTWGWDPEAQFFAALGYAVLKVNYRGSEGYGLNYSPYSHFSSMNSSTRDCIDAAQWLIETGIANAEQLAIYGSSFGGHVALSAAADAPELFKAAIGYAGVYNWLEEIDSEFKKEPIYAKLKLRLYYGDFENDRDAWLAASAISKVDSIRCPVLLLHGRADDVVSSSQSRRMSAALRKSGNRPELKLISFNRHGLAQERNRIDFFQTLARFLETNL